MQSDYLNVRINFGAREIELSGTNEQVIAWWARLHAIVDEFGQHKNTTPIITGSQPGFDLTIPEVFGEYFHDFPSSITDVDKVLAAAHFIQKNDGENCFTTAQASKLLVDHSIKIGNPSQCVKQNVDKKLVFVYNGKYRVSKSGVDHLQQLKNQLT